MGNLYSPGRNGRPETRVRLRVFGLAALLVAMAELALCFVGPMAFVRKPTLMLFPPHSWNLSEEEVARTADFIERKLALTNSYSIVSRRFIEEYFMRTDPGFDRSRLKPMDYNDAQRIAQELDLQRFATAWVYASQDACELTVWVRYTGDASILRTGHFVAPDLESLLQGKGAGGAPIDFKESLAVETPGVGFTDYLVLALLLLQAAIGVLALSGREPGFLVEIVWAPALILFLFAYIYALSANMDYVQRYIATSGQLRLAASTASEQLHALLRYAPLLAIDAAYYVWYTLRRGRTGAPRRSRDLLHRVVSAWALPWVAVSAALFGFAFPSAISLDGIGPLAWFSLVPLFLVLLTARPGAGVFYGVVFGALQALIVNYWHGTYDYVSLHLIMIALVVEYLLFMIVLVGVIRLSGKWGFLAAAALWTLFDYLRSVGLLAYPWGLIGTTQYRLLPLIQMASIGGVWAVDFIVILASAALAWTLAGPALGWRWLGGVTRPRPGARLRRPGARLRWPGARFFPAWACGAFLGVCLIWGTVILHSVRSRVYAPGTPTATVVLLQQNTDPRKHEYRENTETLMELTDRALATLASTPDLVAWPEGGLRLDIRYWRQPENRDSYWGRFTQEFLDYQRGLGTWLVSGTQDHELIADAEGQSVTRYFNSSVLLDADGSINGFYHKIRLVPFSEYFPLDREKFAGLYSLLDKYGISNWGVGKERRVYQHARMRFFTPICFEDAFSDHVRRFVLQGADLILNMSNDYWSLSPVEGRQHGLLALFRAVENHRPLLRATCSGYTVYIDAAGRIQPGSPEPYTEGYTVARVPLPERRLTLYTRWGDWFPAVCALLAAAPAAGGLFLILRRSQRRRPAGAHGKGWLRLRKTAPEQYTSWQGSASRGAPTSESEGDGHGETPGGAAGGSGDSARCPGARGPGAGHSEEDRRRLGPGRQNQNGRVHLERL